MLLDFLGLSQRSYYTVSTLYIKSYILLVGEKRAIAWLEKVSTLYIKSYILLEI